MSAAEQPAPVATSGLFRVATDRDVYQWRGQLDGDTPDYIGPNVVCILGRIYLITVGGTRVDLAHVESFTPLD